jgi:5'-nucleotidase
MRLRPICLQAVVLAFAFGLACRTAVTGSGSALPSNPASDATSGPIHLTIVGTNDFHGHIFSQRITAGDGKPVELGGSAIFAGYLANIRANNPDGVVLVDGGDLLHGTLASNLTEGAVVVDAYNYLQYNAAAIGNHEFDYGPVGPVSVAQPGMDPFGALKARISQARFPLLSVNIYEKESGERPAWLGNDGTTMLELKGIKVGILGLTTPETLRTTNPVNVASLRFGSLAPEALSAAKTLRRRGADIVVLAIHAGGKCTSRDNPRDLSSCNLKDGELFEMLEEIPPGTLDAIVAGHTHQMIGHFVKGTPVIETWGGGETFGTIDLWIDPKQKSVIADKTEIHAVIPLCSRVDETGSCDLRKLREAPAARLTQATFLGRPVVPDQKLAQLLEPARERVLAEEMRKLGVKVVQELGRNRNGESALGDVLTDVMREMEHADVALLNPGGLRADVNPGDLTYGDLYAVLPFENTVATVILTGEELTRLLQAAYGGRRGVYQQSGLEVTLSRCGEAGKVKALKLADGKPLHPERRYKVTMPDFLASGGDGLAPFLSSLPPGRIDLGDSRELGLRDSVAEYLQKQRREILPPKAGRLKILEDAALCISAGS